jgi:ATP-dependent Clp protease ATP-binding subunit ClpA
VPKVIHSDQLRQVLVQAQDLAADAQEREVGPLHLFWGLAGVPRSFGAWMLADLKVELSKIPRTRRSGSHGVAKPTNRPLSSSASRAIHVAELEAASGGSPVVGTGHLLVGLLEGNNEVASAFADLGISRELVRNVLRSSPYSDERYENTPTGQIKLAAGDVTVVIEEPTAPRGDALAVIADLDSIPPSLVVEFMAALDAVHRARGGAGLKIDAEQVGATSSSAAAV